MGAASAPAGRRCGSDRVREALPALGLLPARLLLAAFALALALAPPCLLPVEEADVDGLTAGPMRRTEDPPALA